MAKVEISRSPNVHASIGHGEALVVTVEGTGAVVEVITGLDGRFTVNVTGPEYRSENSRDAGFSETYHGTGE